MACKELQAIIFAGVQQKVLGSLYHFLKKEVLAGCNMQKLIDFMVNLQWLPEPLFSDYNLQPLADMMHDAKDTLQQEGLKLLPRFLAFNICAKRSLLADCSTRPLSFQVSRQGGTLKQSLPKLLQQ